MNGNVTLKHITKKQFKEIEEENNKLREQINSLREFENIIDMQNNIYIVGKGTRQFYTYLLELQLKLNKLNSS